MKIFSQLNEFFADTAVDLGPNLMSCYCDCIFYFVSRANTQEVAEVTCESLTTLLQRIGPNMKRSFWADFTVQVGLSLEKSVPKLIADEMQTAKQNQD